MGEPGSGKSTLAKLVVQKINGVVIEASRSVVFPIAALSGRLPGEEALLQQFRAHSIKRSAGIDREQAMAAFSRIRNAYSSDFIAKALHARYVDQSSRKTFIVSGLRGVENAAYCRLHNDFLIYLDADYETLVERLIKDRGYDRERAVRELQKEQALYRTQKIKKIANLVIDTAGLDSDAATMKIIQAIQDEYRMCKRCVNSARNPAITFDKNGYCQICSSYLKHFNKKYLAKERRLLDGFKGAGQGGYDVMVGISGGKDSTATLATVLKMGFRPLTFTFDTGYLPETTVPRARRIAKQLGVDHQVIDIRPYIRGIDRLSYKKTTALYEEPFSLATKEKFIAAYAEGRKHYSIKCGHALAFVRSCQLCRRLVVRAYYDEARKRNISAIILGINEWTNLSAAQSGRGFRVSGMRTLRPKNQPPVHIFHLPFLLQRTSVDTKRILQKLGWHAPKGEDFIESNSNSCLFARSTERMAKRLLGFHPDCTRLAREVTVGFISKQQALKALGKIHPYRYAPRQVLERAGILRKR